MNLSQQQTREVDAGFREERDTQPVHGDLFLWEERVYQFHRLGVSPGCWQYICVQIDTAAGSQAFEFTLTDGILIRTTAERLVEILLRTHGGMAAEKAMKMCQLFFGMLMDRGWTGPLMTVPTKIAGTVVTYNSKDFTEEIHTDDIRPVLVNLMDVNAHSVCVPETPTEKHPHGRFHRIDFLGSKVEVIPDAMSASEALESLRTQAFPDRPIDKV